MQLKDKFNELISSYHKLFAACVKALAPDTPQEQRDQLAATIQELLSTQGKE